MRIGAIAFILSSDSVINLAVAFSEPVLQNMHHDFNLSPTCRRTLLFFLYRIAARLGFW